ncbi:Hpt domain-containing protein [Aureitalea sp. L0-47]|nr:Hpt domain-containing protein [Aureitalea sp. L0-47]
MIRIIKTELPKEIDTYESQLKEGDFLSAAQSVHKLKHKISILGMTWAYDLAVKYEEDLKKSQTRLEQSFKDVLQLMSRFVNELNL